MTWLIDLDADPPPALPPGWDGGWSRDALGRGRLRDAADAFAGRTDHADLSDGELPGLLDGNVADRDMVRLPVGLLVASDAARAAVDAVDPGRHRTWPITARGAYGARRGTRHGLIVRAFGSALTERGSAVRVRPAQPEFGLPRRVRHMPGGAVALRPDLRPAAALWWDAGLDPSAPLLLCSDALAGRLAGLRVPPLRRCRERRAGAS